MVHPTHAGHDQLFRELLTHFFPDFLLLVAPRSAQHLKLEHGQFLDTATFTDFPQGDHRQLDLVYRTQTLGGEPETVLVHVEVEAEYRKSFDKRMARYGLSLHLRWDQPVLPIALLLKGGSGGGELEPEVGIGWKTVEMAVPGSWVNRFRYLAFSLSAASAEKYLKRKDPLAAALAALMPYGKGSPAEHKLACLKTIARAKGLNPAQSFQLANLVETYVALDMEEEEKYHRLGTKPRNKEIKAMEMTWADKMYHKWHGQGLEEGVKKGRKEGLEKGVKKGRLQGARQTLLRLLRLRFGILPPKAVRQIETCGDLATLHRWSDAVLTAPDLQAVGLEG